MNKVCWTSMNNIQNVICLVLCDILSTNVLSRSRRLDVDKYRICTSASFGLRVLYFVSVMFPPQWRKRNCPRYQTLSDGLRTSTWQLTPLVTYAFWLSEVIFLTKTLSTLATVWLRMDVLPPFADEISLDYIAQFSLLKINWNIPGNKLHLEKKHLEVT